jgi:iron complex outermembrane receptor protein
MNRPTPFALALALFVLAGPAAAEAPEPGEEPKPVKAEVAVVASHTGVEAAASTVAVLTRKEIERLPARSLAELLRYLPSVDVRRRGPEGVQADVSLRGADYNGTLVLVDGEPVNDPQTNHHTLNLDVPADAIERIEVLYGAASALYGSEAVGGVIHVVTRGGALGGARAQVEGRYVHGSHSLDAGSLRVATRAGDAVTVSVDASRSESSGFRDDREHAVGSLRAAVRVDTAIGPVTLAGGAASREFGAYAFYGTRFPNQYEETRTRSLRLSAGLDLGGGWALAPSASVRNHRDDFVLERTDPSFYRNLHETDRTTFRLVARRALLGGTLAVGGEAGRDTIDSTNLGSHARSRWAAFAELGRPFSTASPSAGGFRAGVRADRYEDFGTRLSPQIAAWAALGGGVRARASAGTAFRVPTFTELYYVDPQTAGDPDLRPETATNLEAGLSWGAGPVTFDAAVFYRHGTDVIDFVRSSPSEPFRATNIRTVDTHGLEATVALDPARLGRSPLTRLSLHGAFYSADLEELRAEAGATEGRYVLDPLRTRLDLVAAARLPGRVDALARLSYFDRPSFEKGVFLLDARLGYELLEGGFLEIYLEGDNLGDLRYEEVPGVPLPGRTIALGLRLAF